MKKFFTLFLTISFVSSLLCNAWAQNLITLDLTQSTFPNPIEYNTTGEWNKTYNDSVDYGTIVSQGINFSHLPSGNNWGGYSWEGFTPSICTDSVTTHTDFITYQWGCMAQGGVNGVGTPFLLAYYSEYYQQTNQATALQAIFDTIVAPKSVYLCNVPSAYACITRGVGQARPFAAGDSLTVVIRALDENFEETTNEIHYDLANYRSSNPNDWTLNRGWEQVDLSALGDVAGLNFYIYSSDVANGYTNTSTYFALDQLSYIVNQNSTEVAVQTPTAGLAIYPNPFTDYLQFTLTQPQTVAIYNQQGQLLWQNHMESGQHTVTTSNLAQGIYIVQCGNNTYKVIK